MFDILLFLLLIFGFLMGLKRGFILQLLHLTGFIVAFVLAVMYYKPLGEQLALFIPYPELSSDSSWANFLQSLPLEGAFYNAIAFALIFIAVRVILQIIASMLDFVASIPIISSVNKLLGAVLGFLEIYLLTFILLFILALTPLGGVQEAIQQSSIALFMIEKTPYFSEKIMDLWFSIGN
ncbi:MULTISPECIES: CvpA family protein [Oceanobacillus]|uniref:Transmembrane protein YshB n=1 Tax=Oceanobacillus kimchii TaxID=746691 RepID=A0ABQ5TIT9_9BACI|nr:MULTISPECIES: CvpA family protein [Oceanobacillus]MBT2600877.1 CvpA family protein [Oceanobacillus sp. ISL-74]MBT2650726.1 CvpA family protein [Oceanobacillus sp. ISL-73]MCT1575631.1 CvpA family protein [Oceanobacillus kimchii]MCT2137262.1 CvpA family protein [Oceanobacillus kimchii]GLO66788.1 putative transmembrane protein YshB [Oceanobacillus kimchii]